MKIDIRESSRDELLKSLASQICTNMDLEQTNDYLLRENRKLKREIEYIRHEAYKRGWNEATKKVRNFIKKHMEDWLDDEN